MGRFTYIAAALVSLVACGDDSLQQQPVDTWRDAWDVWSDSLCGYLERCYREEFPPSEHDACVTARTYFICHETSPRECRSLYPQEKLEDLMACESDMTTLACGSLYAPDSCFRAFDP